jgi:hypothetical protein
MHFLDGKLFFGEAISARIVLPNNAQVKGQLAYQLAYEEYDQLRLPTLFRPKP